MEKQINDATGQKTDVMTLSISTEVEKHCIQITDCDKQLKNIENKLKDIGKLLEERVSKLSYGNADTSGLEEEIRGFVAEKLDLMQQKIEIQQRQAGLRRQIKFASESGTVKRLISGKTSGVTGGAVVEIERDGKPRRYMLKNIFDTGKTYKNIFGKEKRHSGKHFYDPNCKSEERAFFTRHTLKEVNDSVLQEFIALRLANVVSPGIAPDAILGKISGDDNGSSGETRYCLLTEMAGNGGGEKFNTLDDISQTNTTKPYGVNKEAWKSFYAIGIGLLNDKDVAKKDNIGVVTKGGSQDANLSLFDLGHASPDEFKLDKKTLLPKSKSKIADGALSFINLFTPANSIPGTFYFDNDIQNILTVEDRKDAIRELLVHGNDILEELKKIKKEMDGADKNVVEDMERRIQARFKQLRAVLEEHSKIEEKEAKENCERSFCQK